MTRRKDPLPEAAETMLPGPTTDGGAELDGRSDVGAAPLSAEPAVAGPRSDAPPAPGPSAPPRRLGVLGPLLGGALAALGGFALSHFDVFGVAAPDRSAEVADLSARLEKASSGQSATLNEMSGEIAAISARVEKLEATPAPAAPDPSLVPDPSMVEELERRLAQIESLPAEGGASTAALTAKLAALERRLVALPEAGALSELQSKLDAALARLNEAEAVAAERAAAADAAADAVRRDLALEALADAVGTGQPFGAELQALADPALQDLLQPFAETGVPTLEQLQTGFPDASREALRVAREISTEDGWADRLADFFASQTGARSLTPREGGGPDAVLSRAEFALSEGRVADAVAELEPLDPAVKAPLAAWITNARAHLAAAEALSAARGT
jgi:hypothetical protein